MKCIAVFGTFSFILITNLNLVSCLSCWHCLGPVDDTALSGCGNASLAARHLQECECQEEHCHEHCFKALTLPIENDEYTPRIMYRGCASFPTYGCLLGFNETSGQGFQICTETCSDEDGDGCNDGDDINLDAYSPCGCSTIAPKISVLLICCLLIKLIPV